MGSQEKLESAGRRYKAAISEGDRRYGAGGHGDDGWWYVACAALAARCAWREVVAADGRCMTEAVASAWEMAWESAEAADEAVERAAEAERIAETPSES